MSFYHYNSDGSIHPTRMKVQKRIGICYQETRRYKKAIAAFTKYLELAWYTRNHKHELIAYDFMGVNYFYIGDIDKATYYHNKMCKGKLEPDGSNIKQIAISRVNLEKGDKIDAKYGFKKQLRDMNKNSEDDLSELGDLELPIPAERKDRPQFEVDYENINNEQGKTSTKYLYVDLKNDRQVEIIRASKIQNILVNKGIRNKLRLQNKEAKIFENENVKFKNSMLRTQTANLDKGYILVNHLSRNRQIKNFALLNSTKKD
mmetsp:Transcript_10055/g.8576  ORF Transcript_10055/g.8576 Transcript_10055/m.8576 type:complete len:260 (-) Transcript_10055:57-836(-)